MKRTAHAEKRVVWMWSLVCKVFRSLNPFAHYADYRRARDLAQARQRELERMERADERELFRQTIQAMTTMVEKAFDVNKVQQEAFAKWMASFDSTEKPRVREWDEDVDNRRYVDRKDPARRDQHTLPDELSGLNQIEQFELLLNKMGS